jgi:hypothetical protein
MYEKLLKGNDFVQETVIKEEGISKTIHDNYGLR